MKQRTIVQVRLTDEDYRRVRGQDVVRLRRPLAAVAFMLLTVIAACERSGGAAASATGGAGVAALSRGDWYVAADTDAMTGDISETAWVIGADVDTARQRLLREPMPMLQLECSAPHTGAPSFDVALLSIMSTVAGSDDKPAEFLARFEGDTAPRTVRARWRDRAHLSVYLGSGPLARTMETRDSMLLRYTTADYRQRTVRFNIQGVAGAMQGLTHCPLSP